MATYSGDSKNEPSSGSCVLGSVINPTDSSTFGLALTNGIAQPNLYGLWSSTGTVQQWYDADGLSTEIKLSGIVRNLQYHLVAPVGYSEIGYGYNLLDQRTFGNGPSDQPQFPMPISSVDSLDLWGTVKYSLGTPSPSSLPYNLFYDLWLENNPRNGIWPQSGDFEIGISLASKGGAGGIGAGPYPTGVLVGDLTDQIYVNGQEQSATWDIYIEQLAKGSSAKFYVFSLITPSPQNAPTISIHFQDFIDCLSNTALSNWKDLSTYRLMGIELGTEYAWGWPLSNFPWLQATWDWSISSYYLTTNSNHFLTLVSSANSPNPTPMPSLTISPKLSLLASALASATVTVASDQSAIVDQTPITGVRLDISGPSLDVGTGLTISSVNYGANQPPGTGSVGVGGVVFFDVKVNALGAAFGSDVNAEVYLTSPSFTANDVISLWDGTNWVAQTTHFVASGTIWCTLPVSDLMGTPIMVTGVHDVAVTNVTIDRTWVYQRFSANMNVTILNEGDFDENVTVAVYYNITANKVIGAQNVTLSRGQNETVTFVWNTTGVPYCHNYTITAVATIPVDNNLTDNTLDGGAVRVRILGDMKGDGKVDILDAIEFANYFGLHKGDARWNADVDMNGDGQTNILDAIIIGEHFGTSGSS
jgi:hypothetical protein